MKRTLILTLLLFLYLPLHAPLHALPQQKKTTPQKRPTPKPKTTPTPTPTPDLRPAAAQVAEQLKLLARFLYVYGKISNGIETADEQAKRGQPSQAVQAQTQQTKASVVANIENLRAGLTKLEQSFYSDPQLQQYSPRLSNAAQAVANAAQLAGANRFDEAGRALLSVADRLADLVVEIR